MKYLKYILTPIISFSIELEHNKYGIDNNCDVFLEKESYSLCYDNKKKGPKYISYNTADFFEEKFVLEEKFILKEDNEINKKYRTEIKDYSKLKDLYYPTKLISTLSASSSLKAKEDSYLLSITVPMNNATFEIWEKIDKLEKSYREKYKQLNIYSGVIYSEKFIGNEVYIPKLFYKIFYAPNSNKMTSFLIPHKEYFEEKNIFKYTVPTNKIEEITNINFYNKIEKSKQDLIEGRISIF